MDRAHMLEELARLDDPTDFEVPGGWAHYTPKCFEEDQTRFQSLVAALAALWPDAKPSRDGEYQDSSILGHVSVAGTMVWLSYFGRLATIGDYRPQSGVPLDAAADDRLVALLGQHGYRYVPVQILAEPYAGPFASQFVTTWGDRFFGYC